MCCFVWFGAVLSRPIFFYEISKKLQIFRFLPANYEQIKYNYLIYNKIKFLFFLLKSIENNKIIVYLQCQTTHTNNNQKQNTMKTQLKSDQGWESLRAAAAQIYKENGDKMRVLFWRKKYELVTSDKDEVRWYSGIIDEEVAALFMDTDGNGFKYYNLIIDPLLRVQIVKTTFLYGKWQAERIRINENLVTIL